MIQKHAQSQVQKFALGSAFDRKRKTYALCSKEQFL